MVRKNVYIFILILLLGIVFRIILIWPSYDHIIFDMDEFSRLAKEILLGQWPVDCCDRTMGYPFLIAGIYSLFGIEQMRAVWFVHIFFDMVSSLMMFAVGKRIGGVTVGWITFLVFLSNPFIASYSALLLSETTAVFFLCLCAYIISLPQYTHRPILWVMSGLSFGFLCFTRMVFLYASIASIFWITAFSFRFWEKRIISVCLCLSFFLLASSYTIVRNLQQYHILSMGPPYTRTWGNFYITFYRDRPIELIGYDHMNPVFLSTMNEAYGMQYGTWDAYEVKYKKKFLEKFSQEWPLFFFRVFQDIVRIWDKYHLGTIYDTWYPYDAWPLRIYNIVFLFFSGFGMWRYMVKTRSWFQNPLISMTLIFLGGITILFSLVSNESRHSIPIYGVLCVWSAYGLTSMNASRHNLFEQ